MGSADDIRERCIQKIREACGPAASTINGVPFAQVSTDVLRRKCDEIDRLAGHPAIMDLGVPLPRRKPAPVFRPPIGRQFPGQFRRC